MEEGLILVMDLDGTLISEEIVKRIYREAYMETLKIMRERGIEIPEEFYFPNFKDYYELARRFKLFRKVYKARRFKLFRKICEIYEDIYSKVLEKILW